MHKIFFVRHAKSSWSDSNLKDLDRPLNPRGQRDAPFMAQKLSFILKEVDLMIISPAKRAQETAQYFTKSVLSKDRETVDKVYHAFPETLIDIVQRIDDDVDQAIIFGHNPGFTHIYNHFSKDRLDNLPTCGIFALETEGLWSEISNANTKTVHLMYPKMYRK